MHMPIGRGGSGRGGPVFHAPRAIRELVEEGSFPFLVVHEGYELREQFYSLDGEDVSEVIGVF